MQVATAQNYSESKPSFCQVMSAPSFETRFVQLVPAPYDNDCSIRAVTERLRRTQQRPVKGEFETTKDYDKRLDAVRRTEVLSGVQVSQTMAFIVAGHPHQFVYDADKQFFRTYEGVNSQSYISKITELALYRHGYYAVPVEKETRKTRYFGKNGFGVTVDVEEEEGTAWALKPDPALALS